MRAPSALLILVLLVACQSSASASPSSSEAPASEPAPSQSASALCEPGIICNAPLPAGDYVSEGTGARIEFTLDDHDWSGLADTPEVGFGLLLADVPEIPAKYTRKKKRPKSLAQVIEPSCTGCEVCIPFCPVDCIVKLE